MDQKKSKKQKNEIPKQVGRWTKQQHQRFVQGLMIYGKNWKKVQEMVSTRTAAQVRSHAQKFFNKLDKQKKKIEGENNNNSQTQFAEMREHYDHITQQTPQKIVALIRKQSKQDKSININDLITTFQKESSNIMQNIQKKKNSEKQQEQIQALEKQCQQLHSMTNLVTAFSNLSQQHQKNQSFFLRMLKKYKKYITDNDFIDLIDIPNIHLLLSIKPEGEKQRKRSFSLVQNNDENIQNYNKLRKLVKLDEKKQQTNQKKLTEANVEDKINN